MALIAQSRIGIGRHGIESNGISEHGMPKLGRGLARHDTTLNAQVATRWRGPVKISEALVERFGVWYGMGIGYPRTS